MSRPRRCVWPSVWVPQPEPLLCFFQVFTTVDPKRLKAQLQRSRRIRGSREARRSVVGRPALALEDPLETETWKGNIPAEYHAISVGFFEERPSGRFGWLNARTGTWAACWTSSAWHDSVRSCAAPRAGCVEAPKIGIGGYTLPPNNPRLFHGPSLLFLRSLGVLPERSLRPAWVQARRLLCLCVERPWRCTAFGFFHSLDGFQAYKALKWPGSMPRDSERSGIG